MKTSEMTVQLPKEIDGFLRRHLGFESLKYQCGRQMTCPGCGSILDCNVAVSVDIYGANTGTLHSTFALCGGCFDGLDEKKALEIAGSKSGETCRLETFDGRKLDADGCELEFTVQPGLTEFKTQRKVDGKVQWVTVAGYAVVYPDFEGFSFAVYHDGKGVWWLIELTTGRALGHSKSASSAASVALQSLNRAGKEKFEAALRRYGN